LIAIQVVTYLTYATNKLFLLPNENDLGD